VQQRDRFAPRLRNIAVIGAGTMGNGIAHTAAASGFAVTLIDTANEILERATTTISANLQRGVDKGRLEAAEKQATLDRIRTTTDLQTAAGADIAIEAIVENFGAKQELFQKLDRLMPEGCILASNTSSISITRIAASTGRADKVIGMHFMNPVPVMPLVEVIRGIATADETYKRVDDLARRLGKTPIAVNDYPGFVSNRVHADDQRGDLRVIRRSGCRRVDRRRDETGHESSDGTASARRLHRPRRLPGDSAGPGRRFWRLEIPPLSIARQNGGRGMAGEKERARFL
jgi:3-hydroxyacyl-CoA dehydrogenase